MTAVLSIFKLLLNSAINNYSAGVSPVAVGTTALQACPSESWSRTVYHVASKNLHKSTRSASWRIVFHYKYSLYSSTSLLVYHDKDAVYMSNQSTYMIFFTPTCFFWLHSVQEILYCALIVQLNCTTDISALLPAISHQEICTL